MHPSRHQWTARMPQVRTRPGLSMGRVGVRVSRGQRSIGVLAVRLGTWLSMGLDRLRESGRPWSTRVSGIPPGQRVSLGRVHV